MNFSIEDKELDNLVTRTKRSSKAEVIRDALTLYEFLLSKVEEGQKIFLGTSSKDVQQLTISTFNDT